MKKALFLLGLLTIGFTVSQSRAATFTFGGGAITFAGVNVDRRSTPYPSTVAASGMSATGPISAVRVKLNNINHVRPDDMELLLVSPWGAKLVILADAGGTSTAAVGVNLTLDDVAASLVPDAGPLASGSFKPTCVDNLNNIQSEFTAPAPLSPYDLAAPKGSATFTSVFGGNNNPNGTWSLYVVDDVSGADGASIGSWTLEIDITPAVAATTTTLTNSPNPSLIAQNVTFTATVRKTSDSTAVTTGTVTFREGAVTLAGPTAVNGSGIASFSTTGLSEGDHTITADYSPGAGFLSSTANATQRVDAATIRIGNTFCNPSALILRSVAPGTAFVYPSHINVSALLGTISKVSLTLSNLTIASPDDVELLLVAPNGARFVPLADAGGNAAGVNNVTLVLDDTAASLILDTALPSTGTYRPSTYNGATFQSPAPAGPHNQAAPFGSSTFASVFNGIDPNGTWSLYFQDDVAGAGGAISNGWCLTFTTTSDAPTTTSVTSAPNPSILGSNVTVTATVRRTSDNAIVNAGSVTFREGLAVLAGPIALNGSGQASFSTNGLSEGFHTITASYGGSPGQYNLSSGLVTQRVDRATVLVGGMFCNPGPITVIQTGALTANVYPSRILVTNAGSTLSKVSVTLSNLTLPAPDDLELLLVSPQGQHLILVSDAGGTAVGATNVTLSFSDAGASFISDTGPLSSGTFKPTSHNDTGISFPAPAPTAPYTHPGPFGAATLNGTFGGINPNGYWSLYVQDDVDRASPTVISNGWCIAFESSPVVVCPSDIVVSNAPGQCVSAPVPLNASASGFPAPNVRYRLGAVPITSPYAFSFGTNVVTATATNIAGTNSCSFKVTVVDSQPPVAGVDFVGALRNTVRTNPAAKLLVNDSNPRGIGSLSVAAVSPSSAQAGSVSLISGVVTYTPPVNYTGMDQFTYTLSDGCGSAQGTVTVSVIASNSPPYNYGSISVVGTNRTLQFVGIPYEVYVIQRATALPGPWIDLTNGTVTATSAGVVTCSDLTVPIPNIRFYRMRRVP